jgi:hypothetical protein
MFFTRHFCYGKLDFAFLESFAIYGSQLAGRAAETIDELIDTNPKCRLFFKIDLQEYFAALICLSAD